MEESRKQFEEAYWDEFGQFEDEERREVFSICECEGGSYYRLGTRIAWWAWQASRQAVEIDMPGGITTREALDLGFTCEYAAGMDNGITLSENSIRAAGLRIKQQ